MLVGLFYQYVINPGPAWTTEGALAVMPLVLIVIGVLLLVYANAMKKKGVLK